QVGENERTAVVGEVQTSRAGDFGKRSVPVIGIENVSLGPSPRRVRADQFVDGAPSLFVARRRVGIRRRMAHDLAPEKAGDIARVGPRNVTVGNVQVGVAIVVEIPGVGGPGPAAHLESRLVAHVLKLPVSLASIQRITACVSAVKGADILWVAFVKDLLLRNPLAGGGPHIGHVDVLVSIVIEIEPRRAHAGARVLNSRFIRDGCEGSVAVVAIKVASPKVVGHVKIERPVRVEIAPGAGETVAIVFYIQSCSVSSIAEAGVAFVVQQKVCRSVARVKIRNWIVILVQAYVIAVEAEVNVETPVAIVVCDGSVGKSSLRRSRKLEGIGLKREFSISLVQKKQWAGAANYKKILDSLVFEISEQSTGRV